MRFFTEHKNENFGSKCFAFTMAEILISLTIVGVIAAIIIPSIQANIEKKARATKHKAFYSRMSQAFAMIDKNLNKYGQYSATYDEENSSLNVTLDTGAMAFVTEALGQTIKMNNICDNENFKQCGVPDKIINLSGTKRDVPTTLGGLHSGFSTLQDFWGFKNSPVNTNAAAFETVNGESVVVYYNPKCQSYIESIKKPYPFSEYIMPRVCVNMIYDLNGRKGPNKIYEDVFILTVLGPENPNVVSPIVKHVEYWTYDTNFCQTLNNGTRLATIDETIHIVINKPLITDADTGYGAWHTAPDNIAIGRGRDLIYAWADGNYGAACVDKNKKLLKW